MIDAGVKSQTEIMEKLKQIFDGRTWLLNQTELENPILTFKPCQSLKAFMQPGGWLFFNLYPRFYRWNITSFSLFCHYFQGRWSDELHFLALPIKTFTARTPCHVQKRQLILFIFHLERGNFTQTSSFPELKL